MKNYSFNDLKVNDIIEHEGGWFYIVTELQSIGRQIIAKRINDTHSKDYSFTIYCVKQIWFCDQ